MAKMEAVIGHFKNKRGKKLYYEQWLPESSKAVIILVHGLCDHSMRYEPFKKFFSDKNYGIFCYDHEGQGRSEGQRGYIKKFNYYVNDLTQFIQFVKSKAGKKPIFVVAHSMGAQVALNYGSRHIRAIEGVVLSAPPIQPIVEVSRWLKELAPYLSIFRPKMILKQKIDSTLLSHDEKVVQEHINDPLVCKDLTVRLGQEILANLGELDKKLSMFALPALILHGSEDQITAMQGSRSLYHKIPIANKEIKIYDGMYHELLNEIGKEKVFVDIDEWIIKQMNNK